MKSIFWVAGAAALIVAQILSASSALADCQRDLNGSWVVHQSNPLDVQFSVTETNGALKGSAAYTCALGLPLC
jgi:hypothetical protein